MSPEPAGALAALRAFNYERIYVRPASLAQSRAVVDVLRALVSSTPSMPGALPDADRRRPSPVPKPPSAPPSRTSPG